MSFLVALGLLAPLAPLAPQSSPTPEILELLCLDCHSGATAEGGADLAAALTQPEASEEILLRALEQIEAGRMPPDGGLDPEESAEARAWVHSALRVDPDDPGRPTLRRLTRSQVERVLRDLLGVDLDASRFLERDASAYGFDTTGDTLFLGPVAFEGWYELVDAAVRAIRANPDAGILRDSAGDPNAMHEALARFMERAFRGPPMAGELQSRWSLVEALLGEGQSAEVAVGEAVRATLLSPRFLYRLEADDVEATGPWRVAPHELAARLSFFLWGSIPDAALLEAAAGGLDDGELLAEAKRMLADPRASWLAEDFASQWLGFRELEDVTPDVRRFRPFNEGLRREFSREATSFFKDLIAADRSVLEVLDSDHAHLNRRLAAHYGIEGVKHKDIRRVPIDDRRRGGVLGMGAILTVTSTPLRTSPVQRGQWVLERLLGESVPPPPPDAGSLPEDDRQEDGLSLRERLEVHRQDAACASCHDRMDPYGLALEAFDGIGRVRVPGPDEPPVDPAVTLPNGSEVDGPVGLKTVLKRDPEAFIDTLLEALFTYAVGRPPGLADRSHLASARERARTEGYRFSSLVYGVLRTPAFTHRRLP